MSDFYENEKEFYQVQRDRCAASYSDWLNDEFNMLDLQFITGIRAKDDHSPTMKTSFNTLNDVTVYFDRASQKFLIDFEPVKNLDELLVLLQKITPQIQNLIEKKN